MLSATIKLIVRIYQYTLGTVLPDSCRYHPTCSEYACEAVTRHGARHGSWLAVKRILRCHPFGGSGHDPVPEED